MISRFARLFARLRPSRREAHQSEAVQWLVVGLGNPDVRYRRSRHNLGFMTLDRLAAERGGKVDTRKFKGLWTRVRIAEQEAGLLKPATYYNLSGESVAAATGYLGISPERVVVVHDELDLPAGAVRIKLGGGDAGNLGIRSVADALGDSDFIRVRVGIGRPPQAVEVKDFILEAMKTAELESFEAALTRAASAIEAIVRDGAGRAMGDYNRRQVTDS